MKLDRNDAEFKVSSSYGHISDLPKKEIGIDFENNFKPKIYYILLKNLESASHTILL